MTEVTGGYRRRHREKLLFLLFGGAIGIVLLVIGAYQLVEFMDSTSFCGQLCHQVMYPVLVTKLLPGWVVPAALVAHSDEAMLALLWIFMVHIFFNHFAPGVFPVNTSIFTGKVARERYQEEHSLEYERLVETSTEQYVPEHPLEPGVLVGAADEPYSQERPPEDQRLVRSSGQEEAG